MPHLHLNFNEDETEGVKTQLHKTTLLVLAITLHIFPKDLPLVYYLVPLPMDLEAQQ
jgi:hypothetical protein